IRARSRGARACAAAAHAAIGKGEGDAVMDPMGPMGPMGNDGAGHARDPHAGQRVVRVGPKPANARLAMILVHGRGASAEDILTVAAELDLADVSYIAPQAGGNTWYPYSFLAPIPQNEPGISSGLGVVSGLVESLRGEGVEPERIALLGFSQGACLSLEFAA